MDWKIIFLAIVGVILCAQPVSAAEVNLQLDPILSSWTTSTIGDGFGDIGTDSNVVVFVHGGVTYMLITNNAGNKYGYSWDGDSWIDANFLENVPLGAGNTVSFVAYGGTIVAIEQVFVDEFFQDKRLQVSVFMSPNNVHVNRYPVSGKIVYTNYWPGSFLVAWHPKSSTENERNTVVVEHQKYGPIMVRQIAGALARRIVCYSKPNERILQGKELGFIKFGSRVDLFLPLDVEVKVALEEKVRGGITPIALLGRK